MHLRADKILTVVYRVFHFTCDGPLEIQSRLEEIKCEEFQRQLLVKKIIGIFMCEEQKSFFAIFVFLHVTHRLFMNIN